MTADYRCETECGVPDCVWCDDAERDHRRERWVEEGFLDA